MGLCIVVSYSRLHLSAVQQGNKLGADSHSVFYKLNVACTPSFHTEFIADRDLSYTVVVIAFIDSTQPPVVTGIDDPTLPLVRDSQGHFYEKCFHPPFFR